jgi:hypothetical protein
MGLDLVFFDDSVDEKLRRDEHFKYSSISFSLEEWDRTSAII